MHLKQLNGKKICILGFGREGQATFRALRLYAPDAQVTVADQQNVTLPEGVTDVCLQAGSDWLKDLDRFDVVIKSPGIPPCPELAALGTKLTNATQIFLDTVAEDGATVIGVTGSKGKSTTSTLIHLMLDAAGHDAFLIGNIGKPSLDYVEESSRNTVFVMEMSSYQLMDIVRSPHIAVITSFFPEHLDYHGSVDAYMEAKKHITKFQNTDDVVFFNGQSEGAKEIAHASDGNKIPFTPNDAPVTLEETRLIGTHNLGNIAAASKVTEYLGVPKDIRIAVLKDFPGLPHRLQKLGTFQSIEWVDDAISTTPESAIAALEALKGRVVTIILGGQDRGNDFRTLAETITASPIKNIILFPGSGARIRKAMEETQAAVTFFDADSMEAAVRIAKEVTPQGTICLLSTASPSYGMFKNFEDKGDQFRRCIGL